MGVEGREGRYPSACWPISIMRRQLIPQIALPRRLRLRGLLAQVQHFADQRVDLGLLADDDVVEFVEQVFGKAGFDFECGQAFGEFVVRAGWCGWHGGGKRADGKGQLSPLSPRLGQTCHPAAWAAGVGKHGQGQP